ncbi:MAG: DMT family transporter [Anaerolineaceae bacterium]|nr:MAG: DMT family transporter [Anaerolineaceae bacterium]
MTLTAILFGIASALTWGAGDFAGGIASKRSSPYAVVIWGDIVGMTVVSVLAFILGDPFPSWGSMIYILLSSFCGAIGIIILYRALAGGQMSIAAPTSALMAAVIPVFVGVIVDGWPKWLTMVGVVMALAAIWLVARAEHEGVHRIHWADVRMPLIAGVLFGLFFVFMHQASSESVLWPAVLLRISSAILLAVIALFTRSSFAIPREQWWLVVFVGIFDIAGNIFYILSAQTGRMDIAAVVGSLYPGMTVALAWMILKERISSSQWIGIAAALTAIVLISV